MGAVESRGITQEVGRVHELMENDSSQITSLSEVELLMTLRVAASRKLTEGRVYARRPVRRQPLGEGGG